MLTKVDYHIRWAIRRDVGEIVRISSFGPCGMDEETWLDHVRQRNVIGVVAEDTDGRIVGYLLYQLDGRRVEVLAFGVHPACRRRKVGRNLVAWVARKLHIHRRAYAGVWVPESCLGMQLLLRSAFWRCVKQQSGRFGEEAGYRFILAANAETDAD